MILCISFIPQPVATLPVANSCMFIRELRKGCLHFTIVFYFLLVLAGSAGYSYQFARLTVT